MAVLARKRRELWCEYCELEFRTHSVYARHQTQHAQCLRTFEALTLSFSHSGTPNALHLVFNAAVRALRTELKSALLRSTNGAARVVIAKRTHETSFHFRDYLLVLGGTGMVTVSTRNSTTTYDFVVVGPRMNVVLDPLLGADWDTAQTAGAARMFFFMTVSACSTREYDLRLKLKQVVHRLAERHDGNNAVQEYTLNTLRIEFWRGVTTRPSALSVVSQ